MQPQDGCDGRSVDPLGGVGQPLRDPVCLGGPLEGIEIDLAALPVHRHHRDEAAAGHEANEQEPPLEVRHGAEG